MNNKLKAVVALAILGAASQAHATIQPGTTGDGELFLSVWDDATKVSYTKDLGVTMSAFIGAGNNVAAVGTPMTINFSSDANFTAFMTAAGGGASASWGIFASDSTGAIAKDGQRYLSTSGNTLAQVKLQTNANVQSGFANINNFLTSVNNTGTHATQADGSSFNVQATDPLSYAGSNPGSNWGGKAQTFTDSTVGLDSSMGFFYITPGSTLPTGKVSAYQFGNAVGAGTWTMSSTGSLAYSVPAVSAVPVPAALWLLGSAMVGLVGVARRKVA